MHACFIHVFIWIFKISLYILIFYILYSCPFVYPSHPKIGSKNRDKEMRPPVLETQGNIALYFIGERIVTFNKNWVTALNCCLFENNKLFSKSIFLTCSSQMKPSSFYIFQCEGEVTLLHHVCSLQELQPFAITTLWKNTNLHNFYSLKEAPFTITTLWKITTLHNFCTLKESKAFTITTFWKSYNP